MIKRCKNCDNFSPYKDQNPTGGISPYADFGFCLLGQCTKHFTDPCMYDTEAMHYTPTTEKGGDNYAI